MWHQRYRLILIIYGIGLALGVREYLVSRDKDPLTWLTPEGAELTAVLAGVNPEDPENDFYKGMQALAAGDEEAFSSAIERALAANLKHNELLLKSYADYLLGEGADWRQINRALNRWRQNYPFSPLSIALPLSAPPRTVQDVERVRQALARIPWIADSQINPPPEGTARPWQVQLVFRRGRTIDIQQAITALSFTSGG